MTGLQVRPQATETDRTTPFSEPWLKSLRSALGWMSGRPVLMSGFTISPDQRRQIASRMTRLQSLLSSEERHTELVTIELAKLLAAFPAQGQSDSPAKLRMEAYFEALADVPAWAVHEARTRIVRGEAGLDARFAPSPPDLAKVCRAILRPIRTDLIDLQNIASAEIEFKEAPKAEHERVRDGFEKLKFNLSSPHPPESESEAA